MENKPIISIIVPVYNVEKYLDRCVESILNQTFKDFELILVDDGSPDDCPAICDEWAEKDSRIKVIHKPNGGVSSARNEGLNIAQGEYIGFCDPDDVINPHMYELMYKTITDSGSDCSVCSFKSFTNDLKLVINSFDRNANNLILENEASIEYFLGVGKTLLGSVWNKLIRKDLILDMRFNEKMVFGEDYCFALEALLNCSRVTILENYELYYYFLRDDSAMKKLNSEKYYKLFVEKQRVFQLCKNKYPNKKTKRIIQNAETRAIVATFLNADEKVVALLKAYSKSYLNNVLISKEVSWKEKVLFIKKLYVGV